MGVKPGGDDDAIYVNDTQVLYPELGPLEGRVTKMYLEELFSDNAPDIEETAYWFHTPEEGWKTEPMRLSLAEEAEVTYANPGHERWQAEGRLHIGELEEGQVITGVISDVWLYHGCQVDFGYMFDGLIPVSEEEWGLPGVAESLMPGDQVVARVYCVRQPGLFRWPVQLQLLPGGPVNSEVVNSIMDPDKYEASIDHGWADSQGWGMEEILQATGRIYQPTSYVLPQNQSDLADEMQRAYGFDFENEDSMHLKNPMQDRFLSEYAQKISHFHDLGSRL